MSLIAVAAIFLLARLAPPLEGLSAQGQGVLGAMVAGAVLWITEATPIGLTAIIVVVLLALCPGISLSAAGSGLASDVVFFLIGAVAIGAAVEASGLWHGRRACSAAPGRSQKAGRGRKSGFGGESKCSTGVAR